MLLCVALMAAASAGSSPGQNLITNPDFEQGNTGFTSDYTYSAIGTSNLGLYSIVTDPKIVQSASSSFGDHTTGTGLMLHANGSSNTNLVAWRQTVAVQTNRLYVFSGWGATSGRSGGGSNDPNPSLMRLYVNGDLLQSGAQLLATNIWTYFSHYWHSGNTNQALLEIRDGVSLGAGNDFNLDDLSFRALDSTNPMVPTVPSNAPPAVAIRWSSAIGQTYQVQWSPDLDPLNWFELGAPLPATGAEMFVTEDISPLLKRFYRVQIIQQTPTQ
jgi:hypothetical protein